MPAHSLMRQVLWNLMKFDMLRLLHVLGLGAKHSFEIKFSFQNEETAKEGRNLRQIKHNIIVRILLFLVLTSHTYSFIQFYVACPTARAPNMCYRL